MVRWLIGLLLSLSVSNAFSQTQSVPLRYELWWDERVIIWISERLKPVASHPVQLPSLQEPQFFVGKFVDGERVFVLAKQGDQVILYADTDGDNDLTDEQPFQLRRRAGKQVFGPIPMRFRVNGRVILQHIGVLLEKEKADETAAEKLALSLVIASRRVGTMVLDGKPTPIRLIDYNVDGAFDSFFDSIELELGEGRDRLFLRPGTRLGRNGNFLRFKATPTGEQLIVEAIQVPTAILRFSGERVRLGLEDNEGLLVLEGQGGQLVVPIGEFRVIGFEIVRIDQQGRMWRLSANAFGPAAPKLVIPKEGTTLPSFEPLQINLLANETDEGWEFSLELKTANGMKVQNLRVNEFSPPEPKLRLTTADGKVIDEPKFHYG